MKKVILYAASALFLAGCSNDVELDSGSVAGTSNTISFQVSQKNTTRANTKTALQLAGHYNFGVFGYKSTDKVNNIMENYLVGYNDDEKGYTKSNTSTWGDAEGLADGKSYWMYEGMGYGEYTGTYAGERVNPGTQFASNVENQYLRYWDKAAAYTYFYAYAPYVNGASTVKYVDGQAVGTSDDTYVMTIPNGTLKHGYDDESKYEFMYASTKVANADYGHDVALNFKRLNAKVNIKFWEDVPGYSVRIIDVNDEYSVAAKPAIKDGTSGNYGYKAGVIYTENGAKIKFADGAFSAMKQYQGTTSSDPLNFAAPTEAQIGEQRIEATPSTTTYYAIPKGSTDAVLANGADKMSDDGTLNTDLALTGLTFHVSYELISNTGEKITVKDATVFVPTDYTNWKANTHYTYIFKITKSSNGTTDSTVDPDPNDPEVPTVQSLYPIVFDNCTVEDWDKVESEHIITEGTADSYHNITLSTYSLVSGDINITDITDNDTHAGHAIDWTAIKVTNAAGTVVDWYSNKKITVPADATPGIYTVTYTCPAGDINGNHPATWTQTFVVGSAYTVNTNLNEVGTHGLAASALNITATKDANAFTPAAAQLSIEYPVNVDKSKVTISTDGKKVLVAQDATPGKYKLVLTIDEGVKVKVAEKVFEVKDYQFALDYSVVYNKVGGTTIKANVPASASVEYASTMGTVSGNTIAVENNTEEGTYTVTMTVNKGTASEVKYEKTFKVQNTYTVALSKAALNTTVGAANGADYGTDFITVTSTKNGVADAVSAELAAKYTIEGLAAADYKFFVDGSAIKLQVKTSVAAGNYTVVYTGQTDKTAKATVTVQK